EPIVNAVERMFGATRDEVAARIRACEPRSRRGYIRAVLRELDHLRRWDVFDEQLGYLCFNRGRPGKVRAEIEGATNSVQDARIAMTQDHRAESHSPIDELVAVRVPRACSPSAH